MKYVYILQSINYPQKFYIGSTNDLKRRFKEHNEGKSIHTNRFKPWRIETYLGFSNSVKANKFEVYLKTCSGRTFAKRHLRNTVMNGAEKLSLLLPDLDESMQFYVRDAGLIGAFRTSCQSINGTVSRMRSASPSQNCNQIGGTANTLAAFKISSGSRKVLAVPLSIAEIVGPVNPPNA